MLYKFMQALILASGKGTQLRPLTVYTPKPIIPILNRPLLSYQIDVLKRAGVDRIVLVLDYQPDKIERLLGGNKELGVDLKYLIEPRPMGTASTFSLAAEGFRDTTIVLNGDILTDLIISKVLKQHKQTRAQATIVLTSDEDSSGYDKVGIDGDNKVVSFDHKSLKTTANTGNYGNAGIYLLEPSINTLIASDRNISFEKDIFPKFVGQNDDLFGYKMENDYWRAIDSIENYQRVHLDFLAGKIRNFKNQAEIYYERATAAFIDDTSVIDNNCVVKANARILNSVLGAGVQVEEHATVKDSVIWSHSRISNSATIEGSVLARSCYVGKNASVRQGSVLGDKTSLTDYTKV